MSRRKYNYLVCQGLAYLRGTALLFEQDRYPVTAVAVTPSRLLTFHRRDVLALLDRPEFRGDFIRMLMERQRYLAERVRYLTSCDVEERFFLFLKEQYGEATTITPDLSKKDIAGAIGATPETLSRLLQRLRREKTLKLSGKTMELPPDFWSRH